MAGASPVSDEERLAIVMQLKYDQLQKQVARAQRSLDGGTKAMEKRTKQAADNMDKTMGKAAGSIREKLSGIFAPFIAGGAVAGAAMTFKKIALTIAEVGREADKARVSTKVWQQWTYVAAETGASIDGMTDALKELNIRGDEFATTGKGSAQEAFERLGLTASDVAERLRDPSRFLDEIIGKLQKMDKAAQARNLDELFGGTGAEELSKVLGLTVEQIQQLRSEAALFTDEQIAAAKKIDAEFETLWRNVMVYSKQAALSSVSYTRQILNAISTLKGDGVIAGSREQALSAENRMNVLLERRKDILERIDTLKGSPLFNDIYDGLALSRLEDDLAAVDNQLADLTPHSKEFSAALRELSNITLGASGAFNGTAAAAANFKQALSELKALVPELKKEMDLLARNDTIDKAFERAVKNARTPADIEIANDIAARARTAAKYGTHKDLLGLIGAVESGGNYNATLDNGRWTGGAQNLTAMTLNEVVKLQRNMLTPENRALYGDGKGSSALGKYQITGRTLRGLIKELGLTGDRLFDESTQDELARALIRRRGNDVGGLRNEWEGLRNVDSTTISNAYTATPTAAQQLAPTEGQQKAIDLAKQQDEARKSLNQTVQEGLQLAQFEQSISGMTASQQRIELELYRYKLEAKRAGLQLTDEEIRKAREQITITEQVNQGQQKASQEVEDLKNAQMFFAQSFTSSLSGLLTGTTTLTDAVKNLTNSLIDAVLQAALLGQGPLAGLFGTATGGGIFGSIFGWAEGGYTGRGGKHEPAGIVHKGEYVMSAAATRRIGVKNLEGLHLSAKRGYSEGGYVGSTPSLRQHDLKPANSNAAPMQQISISAPITVEGSAGTPEQNTDLANKMAKQMEQSMRGMVADELRRASRPGNFGNTRSR